MTAWPTVAATVLTVPLAGKLALTWFTRVAVPARVTVCWTSAVVTEAVLRPLVAADPLSAKASW